MTFLWIVLGSLIGTAIADVLFILYDVKQQSKKENKNDSDK